MPAEETENNVYALLQATVGLDRTVDSFKFVQIHRSLVKTSFSQHEVIQLIDVS